MNWKIYEYSKWVDYCSSDYYKAMLHDRAILELMSDEIPF